MNIEIQTQAPDVRTEYQKAVDMAWRAEGIDKILYEQGDNELANKVENAILVTFTLDPDDEDSARATQDFLQEVVDSCGGYDSGARKFEQPPAVQES